MLLWERVERTNSGEEGRADRWDFRVWCQGEGLDGGFGGDWDEVDIFLVKDWRIKGVVWGGTVGLGRKSRRRVR